MMKYERIDISEEIDSDKTGLSRECVICHYWILKMLDLNLSQIFVINVVLDVFFQKQKELQYQT